MLCDDDEYLSWWMMKSDDASRWRFVAARGRCCNRWLTVCGGNIMVAKGSTTSRRWWSQFRFRSVSRMCRQRVLNQQLHSFKKIFSWKNDWSIFKFISAAAKRNRSHCKSLMLTCIRYISWKHWVLVFMHTHTLQKQISNTRFLKT